MRSTRKRGTHRSLPSRAATRWAGTCSRDRVSSRPSLPSSRSERMARRQRGGSVMAASLRTFHCSPPSSSRSGQLEISSYASRPAHHPDRHTLRAARAMPRPRSTHSLCRSYLAFGLVSAAALASSAVASPLHALEKRYTDVGGYANPTAGGGKWLTVRALPRNPSQPSVATSARPRHRRARRRRASH